MTDERGVVVKGPDLFADEEAVYVAATTTRRSAAIPLTEEDFVDGGLPRETYVNPWTVVTIRHADIHGEEGRLIEETTEASRGQRRGIWGFAERGQS